MQVGPSCRWPFHPPTCPTNSPTRQEMQTKQPIAHSPTHPLNATSPPPNHFAMLVALAQVCLQPLCAMILQPCDHGDCTLEEELSSADDLPMVGEAEAVTASAGDLPAVAAAAVVAASAGETCLLQDIGDTPVKAKRGRPDRKKKKKLGRFSERAGHEYRKHVLFRRDNGLISSHGTWLLSERLQSVAIPPMSARMLDLLHILWLLFEQRGVDPEHVDQMWLLCQSLHRASVARCKKGALAGQRPHTPGLHLQLHRRARALVPCVLPRGVLWLNRLRRFATGAEMLQFQGVPLHTECGLWRKERDCLLKSIAGNGFAVPVVAWYVLLAVASVARSAAAPFHSHPHDGCNSCRALTKLSAAAVTATVPAPLTEFSFARFADELLQLLLNAWPDCFSSCPPRVLVKMGTLCSGGDFIVPMSRALLAAIGRRPGLPRITLQDEFACEIDPSVRGFRKRALPATQNYYCDCHAMPVERMTSVDILVFGSACKSLSSQKRVCDRRGLMHTDPHDKKCTSGATTRSCLRYVLRQKPQVVIIENVVGILHDINVVLEALRGAGYTCGHDTRDATQFFLPQTRRRVYIWAHAQCNGCMFCDSIRLLRPSSYLPVDACLLDRARGHG